MRYVMSLWVAAFLVLQMGCGSSSSSTRKNSLIRVNRATTIGRDVPAKSNGVRLPKLAEPQSYNLRLHVDPSKKTFSGVAEIAVRLVESTTSIFLHADSLQVRRVEVEALSDREFEENVDYAVDAQSQRLRISLPAHIAKKGSRWSLRIHYEGRLDGGLNGAYRVEHDGHPYVFTQFEPVAARKAFPCFDEPSYRAPLRLELVVPKGMTALSNAPQVERDDTGSQSVVVFDETPALPSYLYAFAVGPFDVVAACGNPEEAFSRDVKRRPVPIYGVAAEGRGADLALVLKETREVLSRLERYTDQAYPFRKLHLVAVPDFAAGAMENPGLITFRDTLLLLDDSAEESVKRRYRSVLVHELAHQWFGNLVTMRWWDDLWLNEGFATWLGNKLDKELFSPTRENVMFRAEVLRAMRQDALPSARKIRQSILSSHDIQNAFDSITYLKGGAVLSMLESWLGERRFRDGLRLYLQQFRWSNADVSDLGEAIAQAARSRNRAYVSSVLDSYVMQAGLPFLRITRSCKGEDELSLKIEQSRYGEVDSASLPDARWTIPFCATYGVGDGQRRLCRVVDATQTQLRVPGATCQDWVLPNADGRGYYRFALDVAGWQAIERALSRFSGQELLVLSDALQSSLLQGRIELSQASEVFRALASSEISYVAHTPMQWWRFVNEYVVRKDDRDALRAYGRGLFGQEDPQQFERLLLESTQGESRRRLLALLRFLTFDLRVSEVRSWVKSWYSSKKTPLDLWSVAAGVVAQDSPKRVLQDGRRVLLNSSDGLQRRRWIQVLSKIEDGALLDEVSEISLSSALRKNERMGILFRQLARKSSRQTSWRWLKRNFSRLTESLSAEQQGALPLAVYHFCDEPSLEEVKTLFGEFSQDVPGGPRNLKHSLESISRCISRSQRMRPGLERFLAEFWSH